MSRCLATNCRDEEEYIVTTGPSFFTVCAGHAQVAALGALRKGLEASVIRIDTRRPVVLVIPRTIGERHFGKRERVLF